MALVFQDLFTGTDGEILGDRSGWSETGGLFKRGDLQIQSNRLQGSGSSGTVEYACYADAGANDHWASFEVDGAFPAFANSFYPFVTPNGASNPQDYMRVRVVDTNTVSVRAETSADGRIINTNLTSATSEAGGFPLVSGDRIEVRRVGNTVDVYKNASDGTGGVHLNATVSLDVSGATVGLPETSYSGFTDETGGSLDDFRIGTFAPATSIDDIDGDGAIQDGQGTFTVTTSGFSGEVNSLTVSDGTYTSANLFNGGTGGSYTGSATSFESDESGQAAGQPNWFTGTLELTAGDGTDTASDTLTWAPAADWATVTITGDTYEVGHWCYHTGRESAYPDGSVVYYNTTEANAYTDGTFDALIETNFHAMIWDSSNGAIERVLVDFTDQDDGQKKWKTVYYRKPNGKMAFYRKRADN